MSTQELLIQAASKNAELLQGLNDTAYASSAIQQSQAYLSDIDRETKDCDAQVRSLESKTKTKLADHKKYAESTARRFMHRAVGKKEKFAEKVSKEEREYVEALAEENQAKSRRGEWVKNRDEARKHHAELEGINSTHRRLQAELDALYDSIFAGPTPEFADEDQKEWALRQASDALNDAKRRHEAEAQAVKCLHDADRFMNEALRAFDDARNYSRVDMFGGGTLTDIMERRALSRAQSAADKVKMMVAEAQRLVSDIQDLGNIDIPHGHIMSDIIFDNIFTDMAQHDRIKNSQAQAQREARNLKDLLGRTQQRSGHLLQEANAASARLETSRKELQQIRQDTFERVARPPTHDQAVA
ncbi:MAG: hypothetical protein L6R35_001857 [Caloplaca aegaea]|nr:MAG: hypothetical protein L6R35_001857 [Caloplaca aegaea]